jgi:DNA-binding CsgD family transcriptional regulator
MREPLSAERFSHFVGAIYDCALDPSGWPATLSQLYVELDFVNAALSLIGLRSGEILLNIMVGPEPAWLERNARYGADALEAWGGLEKLMSYRWEEPVVLSQIRDRADWADNRYFKEWGRPQGIHDVMAVPLTRDPEAIGSLGFGRHDLQGEIGKLEVEAASLLAPHLQRAVAIGRLLDLKTVIASTFEATFETMGVAIVLVDSELRIIHANTAARTIFSATDSIRSERGVLTARPASVAMALDTAVRQAARDETGIGRRGFGIPITSADGGPRLLHVLPLRHGAVRRGLVPSAVAAIFITPATAQMPAPTEGLAALFDLTPAEARVFGQIAAGKTKTESAKALGIQDATVKTHLERIFAKTGTRRQAELVALNASLAPPLRP